MIFPQLPKKNDAVLAVQQAWLVAFQYQAVRSAENSAQALAQADVGIAMGAAEADIAMEAAHIALMREYWNLVPEVLGIAKRTMRIVKGNLLSTTAYNVVGLTLAATGILPPVLAAAAQSLPDIGIMGNSARLLRQR